MAGTTEFKGIDPGGAGARNQGGTGGQITSRFDLDEAGHWQLALPELKVDGKLNQYPLALQGRLSGNDKMEWTIPALALQSGPNRLQAKGSLTTQAWKLDADLDAPKLGGIYPGLGGDIKGQVRVTGNQQAPRVNADLVSGRLAYAGTVLKETVIKANALVGEKPAGEVAVTVASLAQGETQALANRPEPERRSRAPRARLTMKGDPLAADLSLNGSLRGDHWRGALAELKLKTPPQALGADRPLVSGPGSAETAVDHGGSLPRVPEGQSLRQGEPDSPVRRSGICPEQI